MPSYNVTLDDASPMIHYDGQWLDTYSGDQKLTSYANSTFHSSNTAPSSGGQSSTATLNFNGTAIYLYGANRDNHGQYQVTLDGKTTDGNGYSTDDKFEVVLFSQTGLDPTKEHQVVLANSDPKGQFVDLDYAVVTLGDGNEGHPNDDQIDDMSSVIQYDSTWEQSGPTNFIAQSYNASYHATSKENGHLTIPFYGNAIKVYGGTATNHGMFSVSLDGQTATVHNGSAAQSPSGGFNYRGQQILYVASGLERANHTVTMTNVDNRGLYVDIDFFVQEDWGNASSSSSKLGGGAIAGIVIGVLVPLILCVLGFFWWRRRRNGFNYSGTRPIDRDVRPFSFIPPPNDRSAMGDSNEPVLTDTWRSGASRPPGMSEKAAMLAARRAADGSSGAGTGYGQGTSMGTWTQTAGAGSSGYPTHRQGPSQDTDMSFASNPDGRPPIQFPPSAFDRNANRMTRPPSYVSTA